VRKFGLMSIPRDSGGKPYLLSDLKRSSVGRRGGKGYHSDGACHAALYLRKGKNHQRVEALIFRLSLILNGKKGRKWGLKLNELPENSIKGTGFSFIKKQTQRREGDRLGKKKYSVSWIGGYLQIFR